MNTTDKMRRAAVYFAAGQLETLRELSAGRPVAELVRNAVDLYIKTLEAERRAAGWFQ